MKDPSHRIGALLPCDCWPVPNSTCDATTTSGDVFFLMLGLRKQATNKSQMLKPLPVGILCGPDAELGAGPPAPCSPQAVTLGAAGTVKVAGLGLWNQLCSRAVTHICHPKAHSLRLGGYLSLLGVELPARPGCCSLVGGGGLPRYFCRTSGHLLEVGGQKPGWHPASEALGALSWATSPHPCPAVACLVL